MQHEVPKEQMTYKNQSGSTLFSCKYTVSTVSQVFYQKTLSVENNKFSCRGIEEERCQFPTHR